MSIKLRRLLSIGITLLMFLSATLAVNGEGWQANTGTVFSDAGLSESAGQWTIPVNTKLAQNDNINENQDEANLLKEESKSKGDDKKNKKNQGNSTLTFGNVKDEKIANLSVSGNSGITSISTSVGELDDTYTVRYLDGKDSEMSFTLSGLEPNKPLTLEVEEIHNRNSKALAYYVLVNGQEQYFRTYEEISSGPNHYFINIDSSVIGNSDSVRVTFKNFGDSTVNFGRVWAYSDFDKLLEGQKVYKPLTIGLFQPQLTYNDYQRDLEIINNLKNSYSGFTMYDIGLSFDIRYMKLTKEQLRGRIDYLMKLSHDTGIPLHLSVNSWWGGTPSGPDGNGGYWNDIIYNQVVYDPLNIDGRGNWKLSTPNVWSDTPWLSMNNDYYNSIRAEKIKELTEYISAKTAEYQADGVDFPPVVVFSENEPVYWPFYGFNASPNAAGDFSPLVIAAAAKDGVTLNPEDGLSDQERLWMFNNLNKYISTVGRAMADGYGYNATVIKDGNITYPDYQLVENAYSHMFITSRFPNWDDKRAIWETHMLKDIRYGAEWTNNSEGHYLDYIVARGRFAYVNTERTMISDFSVLPDAYASGADHDTIYNYFNGDQDLIREYDNKQNDTFETPTYENFLFRYDFKEENSLDTNSILVQKNGVRREPLNGIYVISPDNGSAEGGEMTFKVDNQGKPLSTGLSIVLEGRCLSNMNPNCKIEVLAGTDPENMTLVKTLTGFSKVRVDLSEHIDKSKNEAFFKIKLYSPGLQSSLYSWSSIKSVKAQTPWGVKSGHIADSEFNFTLKQMRERSLWVSYRADVERMLSNYLEKAGNNDTYNEIKEQYDACKYVTAYNMLNKALSQILPAKYIVKGSGSLGEYPVDINVADPEAKVRTTLYTFGNSVKIGFISDKATNADITVQVRNDGYYKAVDKGNGIYEIIEADSNDPQAVQAVDKMVSFNLAVLAEAPKQFPAEFEARFYGKRASPEGHVYIQSQEPEIGEYMDFIDLKLADNAVIKRGAEGDTDDKLQSIPKEMLFDGDLLKITMNSNQEVSEIKAYYGKLTGTVTNIEPISIIGSLKNAFIQIRDSEGTEHRFEIGPECRFDSPKATGVNILTAYVDDIGFDVGDEITVYYSPYTYLGSEKRALRIAEIYDTFVSETLEDDTWESRTFHTANVNVGSLDTNYKFKVLSPEDTASPAEIVWKLDKPSGFGSLTIEYSGRAIMNDGSSVKWLVSADGTAWSEVGGIQVNSDNANNSTMKRVIMLHDQVDGLTSVYVKCEIRSGFSTWGSLNDVSIKSKASSRELDTAEISLNGNVYVGDDVSLVLDAFYNNGDPVNLMDVRVKYVSEPSGILDIREDGIKAVNSGSAQLQGFISDGGKVLVTNPLTVEVRDNELGSIQVSLANNSIPAGGTTSVIVAAYNTDGIAMDPSTYTITYSSDNESVATVSADGTVTGVGGGTANITANVTYNGVSLQDTVEVTVIEKITLLNDDFESYNTGAVANAGAIGAYEVSNIQIEPLDPPSALQQGLAGLLDEGHPNNPSWQFKKDGYVIYKLDSANPAGFRKLTLSYSGRAVYVPGVGANGTVKIFAGEDTANLQQIDEMPQNGSINTVYSQDLTGIAQGKNTIYIKVEIKSGRYSWAFLDSIMVEEEF